MTRAVLTEVPVSPFKGLANYTEQDAALFFGRDREREIIIANLKARRLTLLYGESGVGKSSLLRAGVMADLSEAARRNLADLGTPEHVPVIFSAWSDEPVTGLAAAIAAAVHAFADDAGAAPDSGSLVDVIAWAAECTDAHLLVILDQFEEYFLYHATDKAPGTFATELPDILNRPGVQANVVISIREDALAKLDLFKRDVPRLFDSSLRINHLDTAAARQAIERPVERYNAIAAADEEVVLEAGLVDAVIDQVRSGRVVLEQTGQGTLEHGEDEGDSDRIETPYLQLVMARLWNVEAARGSPTMCVATLAELGGAQEIVRTHLDSALHGLDPQEKDTAAALFHQLVTPSGTKIAHAVPDLAEYARRPEPEVRDVLEKLSRPETRILRPVPPPPGEEGPERFEIFHDVLAPSVLAWRTRHTAARRIEEQRRAARAATRKRLLRVVGIVAALGLAAVVYAVVSNAQRRQAQEQEARAQAFADEASRLRGVAERQASRAEDEAARARILKGRAETQAARARLQKARAAAQAARASDLADENRRRAVEAQALADKAEAAAANAHRQRALALEQAAFDPQVQGFFTDCKDPTAHLGPDCGPRQTGYSAFIDLEVPSGTVVWADCFRFYDRPRAACDLAWLDAFTHPCCPVFVSYRLEGVIPDGYAVNILTTRRNIGRRFLLAQEARGRPPEEQRSERCRPRGSRIPSRALGGCGGVRVGEPGRAPPPAGRVLSG